MVWRALLGLLLSAIPFQVLGLLTAGSMGDGTPTSVIAGLERAAGLRVPRVAAAIVTATLGFVLAVLGHGHYADLYTSYLVVTLYWIAPFIGIVLADWWVRRGPEAAAPSGWTAEATLFVATSVVTVALFSSTDLYTGPVAAALGGADLGYYVGFAAAFGGTVALRRRRRHASWGEEAV